MPTAMSDEEKDVMEVEEKEEKEKTGEKKTKKRAEPVNGAM